MQKIDKNDVKLIRELYRERLKLRKQMIEAEENYNNLRKQVRAMSINKLAKKFDISHDYFTKIAIGLKRVYR